MYLYEEHLYVANNGSCVFVQPDPNMVGGLIFGFVTDINKYNPNDDTLHVSKHYDISDFEEENIARKILIKRGCLKPNEDIPIMYCTFAIHNTYNSYDEDDDEYYEDDDSYIGDPFFVEVRNGKFSIFTRQIWDHFLNKRKCCSSAKSFSSFYDVREAIVNMFNLSVDYDDYYFCYNNY